MYCLEEKLERQAQSGLMGSTAGAAGGGPAQRLLTDLVDYVRSLQRGKGPAYVHVTV